MSLPVAEAEAVEMARLYAQLGTIEAVARTKRRRAATVSAAVRAVGVEVPPPGGRTRPLLERLMAKVAIDENGCWLWTASVRPNGYGQVAYKGSPRQAHRVVYEAVRGPIPGGLPLDHLCRVRHCVNPAHLEPVTHRENVRRGANAQKTHCLRGHPLSGDNLFRNDPRGWRKCKACDRLRKGRPA